ncbi:ArsR family transcriptional regulator [Chromobacterium sp. F49]|nr:MULTISPECIES: metalloregulator ArsR/SmtB family transcription factor [Chromobacterium]KUM02872.1 ArsR family transcriptional regulator [Chromobacterium subtsugae]KZE84089.1 ArsR family transcriptional regulator [Chromobacterium sp. F49]WSE93597.1 metalloregulator ArsR/SmtB family transcription factor [Chromobacterium subtsugae]WVH61975.1 metalloregulator ArsR/SmtB family transcription factor [Chromobacterium subtsugae]
MSDGDIQGRMFDEFAELARTLGNAHRLLLLEHAAQGERPVERLAQLAGLTVANASQHLQQLKRAGLVASRRDGKHVLYRLGDGPVVNLLDALRQCAEHRRREMGRLSAGADGAEAVSREALLERLRDGDALLLDVRPADEYAQGHLPGALNIPLEMLPQRLAELPAGLEVIAYCRGPFCALSVQAVAALRAGGLAARRLADGFPDWKAAGLPVEMS